MTDIKLNSRGLDEVAKRRETRSELSALGEQVADNMRSQGIMVGAFKGAGEIPLPVKVFEQTTDRARISVQIIHPAGKSEQARRGVITKAAAAAGLKVNG